MARLGRLFLITLVFAGLLTATVAVAGCGEETKTGTAGTTAQDPGKIIGDRALKTFASTPTSGEYANNSINGANLAKKLADPAEKANIYLLDIRSKKDYDNGHIEGAVQVDFAKWADPENIKKLPANKKIVVVCYTGNTAAQTAMGLRMLGYDAVALRAGMNGWAQTTTQQVVSELQNTNYPVVTTPAGASAPAPQAVPFDKPANSDQSVLQDKAAEVMASMPTSGEYANNTITPAKLSEKLGNASERDRLFLVDIRGTNDYNKGHIDGATNIPFLAVAVPDNLKLLPKDKKIVVICYTGNTAGQTTTILRMLGYDAVVLKYGMMGWSGNGKDNYIKEIQAANNPVVKS